MDCVITPDRSCSTLRMLQPHLQIKSRASALSAVLLFLGCSALHAQTPTTVILLKLALSEQTSALTPSLVGFGASAQVSLPSPPTSILNVTLVKPNGSQVLPRTAPTTFSLLEVYFSRASMDAQFPDGTYMFNHTGSNNLSYNLSLASPATLSSPLITNFAAAQSISNPSNFTLTWASIAGA